MHIQTQKKKIRQNKKNKNQIDDFNRLFNDKLINPKNYTVEN